MRSINSFIELPSSGSTNTSGRIYRESADRTSGIPHLRQMSDKTGVVIGKAAVISKSR